MNQRLRHIRGNCWWMAVIVLAIMYGCDVKEACGQDLFRGLAIGGWRRSPPQMICPPGQCGPGGCGPQQQSSGQYVPPAQSQQPATNQQRTKCQPATVRVVHKSDDGRSTSGNGTLIAVDDSRGARHGLIITCAHLQKQSWQPSIILAGVTYPVTLLGVNPAYELMALEAQVPRPTHLMPLATTFAAPGVPLYWEGYVSDAKEGQEITGYFPRVYTGPSLGYVKAMLKARGTTVHGQSGGPIYNETGLHAVLTRGTPDITPTTIEGPCAAYIRQWLLECCQITIDADDHYRIETGESPRVAFTTEPDAPLPPDVDLPVPDVDTPDPSTEPSPCVGIGRLTLLLAELTKNQTDIISNQTGLIEKTDRVITLVDDLTTRVDVLEMGYDELKARTCELSEEDVKIYAAGVAAGLLDNATFIAAVAGLVKVPPRQIDAIADKVRQRISGEIRYEWTPETPTGGE